MPKIDIGALPVKAATGYPAPYNKTVNGRTRKQLGNAVGLDQFGVNLTTLAPGAASAERHWHEKEDELVYVLSGTVMLIDDDGETELGPGDAAGFKAGDPNGHHIVNRSDSDALLLEIGSRKPGERAHYPDIDLAYDKGAEGGPFFHKSGDPY